MACKKKINLWVKYKASYFMSQYNSIALDTIEHEAHYALFGLI